MKKSTVINCATLEKEFQWFATCLDIRFKKYFNADRETMEWPPAPDLKKDRSDYAQLISKFDFGPSERLILCLAMAPHLKPQSLDLLLTINPQLQQPFTEFGGYTGTVHNGFLPTGETAAFLLSNGNIEERVKVWELFNSEHPFAEEQIIYLDRKDDNATLLSGRLLINEQYLNKLISGVNDLSPLPDNIPARRLTTTMNWDDLIVSPYVLEELNQISSWIKHSDQLMEDATFKKFVTPGFRSLFFGPPGTGKTLAASLIAKNCGLEIYRINLSMISSKNIGKTEKNLAKIFDVAENKNWLLFFDEADSLFGKRTTTNSSNDRSANQQVAYLLQRMKDFPGVIILSLNLKSKMDEAFSRRFQSTIYFPVPSATERLRLWKNIFNGKIKPEAAIDLHKFAQDFELSGGSIINIMKSSTLEAVQNGKSEISKENLLYSIRKEFQKYEKTI